MHDASPTPVATGPTEPPVHARHARFTALLAPLLDSGYGLALHLARHSADAEDVVQEAALLAYRHFDSFEPGSNFRAWFFRIIVNQFYSRHRRRRREGVLVDMEDAVEQLPPDPAVHDGCFTRPDDPADRLQSRLDGQQISRAIAALPDEFRPVCTLYFVDDLPYKEIAEALALPLGTVRSRLHRGRKLLQQSLGALARERGLDGAKAEADNDGA